MGEVLLSFPEFNSSLPSSDGSCVKGKFRELIYAHFRLSKHYATLCDVSHHPTPANTAAISPDAWMFHKHFYSCHFSRHCGKINLTLARPA